MKIKHIRFKNLNSLTGEWEIDFTDPAFVSDGIFAITGQTGAGKTTILDAICLGLYGRTPRLDRITKKVNETLSRGTTECFAEVTFQTSTGMYRSHWSQRRARNQIDGRLQDCQHEISNSKGEILASKLNDVQQKTLEITGMTYDQFTRSMLLAQGNFAAFLKAKSSDRTSILEQITGTERYSQISISTHKRTKIEEKKLDLLQGVFEGITLLSAAEINALKTDLNKKQNQKSALREDIETNKTAIQWLEIIESLQTKREEIEKESHALKDKKQAFAPTKKRLDLAEQAAGLTASHSELSLIRDETQKNKKSLAEKKMCLLKHEKDTKEARKAEGDAQKALDILKSDFDKAKPNIKKARELDNNIRNKDKNIKKSEDKIKKDKKSLKEKNDKQNEVSIDQSQNLSSLKKIQDYLDDSAQDSGLVDQLSGLKSESHHLSGFSQQLTEKISKLDHAKNLHKTHTETWQVRQDHLQKEQEKLKRIQTDLDDKNKEIAQVLKGKDSGEWRRFKESSTQKNHFAKDGLSQIKQLTDIRHNISKLETQEHTLTEEKIALHQKIDVKEQTQSSCREKVELLETELMLRQRIQNLEEERLKLQDDQPCPLCGATNHPFAYGNIPSLNESHRRLMTARDDLESGAQELSDQKVRFSQIEQSLKHTQLERQEEIDKDSQVQQDLEVSCSQLKIILPSSDLVSELEMLKKSTENQIIQSTNVLESVEDLEKQRSQLIESKEKFQTSCEQSRQQEQKALHAKKSAADKESCLTADVSQDQKQQQILLTEIQKKMQSFGITVSLESMGSSLKDLEDRRHKWMSQTEEKDKIKKSMTLLEERSRSLREHILDLEKTIQDEKSELEICIKERDSLDSERRKVLGDQEPDDVEKKFEREIEEAEGKQKEASDQAHKAETQTQITISSIGDLEEEITENEDELKHCEGSFQHKLKESGFSDEKSYESACLKKEERDCLEKEWKSLEEEELKLSSKRQENKQSLENELDKNLTSESLEDLRTIYEELSDQYERLVKDVANIEYQIADNENKQSAHSEQFKKIEKQQKEYERWKQLDHLIGHSKGTSYRDFAQGMTFEKMISIANLQLKKINDRYSLTRNDNHPLELSVRDNYQAGEIRSIKNLSGGETFLISLSLALGLSQMASQNVRVDSLFLDEGFGTLDEDALDMALDALSELHHENKMIGIISHVAALKERIPTQINIQKRPGGRSEISGPGCRKIQSNN